MPRRAGQGPPCPSSPGVPSSPLLTALSPSVPPAWVREEAHCTTSSGDDTDVDMEGLRRRRGREPGTPQPGVPLAVEDRAGGEGVGGELGISLNMCLLGALVLLGLGVLLFSGERGLPAGSLNSALALLPPALPLIPALLGGPHPAALSAPPGGLAESESCEWARPWLLRVCPLWVLREVAFWVRSREAGLGHLVGRSE